MAESNESVAWVADRLASLPNSVGLSTAVIWYISRPQQVVTPFLTRRCWTKLSARCPRTSATSWLNETNQIDYQKQTAQGISDDRDVHANGPRSRRRQLGQERRPSTFYNKSWLAGTSETIFHKIVDQTLVDGCSHSCKCWASDLNERRPVHPKWSSGRWTCCLFKWCGRRTGGGE